ncbi:MAG: DUF2231 domain-containing protein [Aquificae bacterium]|nr:DUF2231 domain-containing protein [Aquificota bacterium]
MVELHPPVVHFAIALPLAGLLFEVLYRLTGREIFSHGAFLNFSLGAVFVWLAWLTGGMAEEAVEEAVEGTPAYGILELHETLGLVVSFLVTALAVFKFLEFKGKRVGVFVIVLGFLTGALLVVQGRLGGKLVYEHGVGVKVMSEEREERYEESGLYFRSFGSRGDGFGG